MIFHIYIAYHSHEDHVRHTRNEEIGLNFQVFLEHVAFLFTQFLFFEVFPQRHKMDTELENCFYFWLNELKIDICFCLIQSWCSYIDKTEFDQTRAFLEVEPVTNWMIIS